MLTGRNTSFSNCALWILQMWKYISLPIRYRRHTSQCSLNPTQQYSLGEFLSLFEGGSYYHKLYKPQSRVKFLLYSSKRDFLLVGECRRYKYKSKVNTVVAHTFTFLAQLIRSCWLFQGGWNFPWAMPWSGLMYLGFPGSPTHGKRGETPVELERWKHQGKV